MSTTDLFPDEDLEVVGTWYEDAHSGRWTSNDGRVIWKTVSHFDNDDTYCGRAPSLVVDGKPRPFEHALEFGRRLGRDSLWIRPSLSAYM